MKTNLILEGMMPMLSPKAARNSNKNIAQRVVAAVLAIFVSLRARAADTMDNAYWNLPKGVTKISNEVWTLHMIAFWVCVAIGVVVFGVMFYSLFAFRRSKNPVPAKFHESTVVEIIWTIIPFVILIGLAVPAAGTLIREYDTRNSDMTIKITGYQWKWQYEYVDQGVSFFSMLDPESNKARQLHSGIDPATVPNYLHNVDNPLVLPVGKKIRFLLTSDDVIHGWWMPDFALKKDAIPGYINEMWTVIDEPGTYRGQCTVLCGRDHGFMPIVVKVLSEADYNAWLAQQKAASGTQVASAAPAVASDAAPAAPAPATPAALPAQILFESGKTTLSDADSKSLAAAIAYLKANADAKVEITGYTDQTGDAAKNKELAKERAKAVREALRAGGIAESRWTMKPPEEITGSGDNDQARRVDIVLAGATPAAAAPAAATPAVAPTAAPAPAPQAAAAPAAAAPAAPAKLSKDELVQAGQKIYSANCQVCHQPTGAGMAPTFPSLINDKVVTGPVEGHITQILKGKNAMPPFSALSDSDIAAVATYERNSWGNNAGEVQPSQVTALRGK